MKFLLSTKGHSCKFMTTDYDYVCSGKRSRLILSQHTPPPVSECSFSVFNIPGTFGRAGKKEQLSAYLRNNKKKTASMREKRGKEERNIEIG